MASTRSPARGGAGASNALSRVVHTEGTPGPPGPNDLRDGGEGVTVGAHGDEQRHDQRIWRERRIRRLTERERKHNASVGDRQLRIAEACCVVCPTSDRQQVAQKAPTNCTYAKRSPATATDQWSVTWRYSAASEEMLLITIHGPTEAGDVLRHSSQGISDHLYLVTTTSQQSRRSESSCAKPRGSISTP